MSRRDRNVMRRNFNEEKEDFVAINTGSRIEQDYSCILDRKCPSCFDDPSSAIIRSSAADAGTKFSSKTNVGNSAIDIALAKQNLVTLREALQKHCAQVFKFTEKDAITVINSIFIASKNDYRLIAGTADFVALLLNMEEYNSCHKTDSDQMNSGDYFVVMTRDTLVASAFHYCDCVLAREAGIYDVINGIMRNPPSLQEALLPSLREDVMKNSNDVNEITRTRRNGRHSTSLEVADKSTFIDVGKAVSSEEVDHTFITNEKVVERNLEIIDIEEYGEEAMKISNSLAQIKKAEIMTHALAPQIASSVYPSPAEASSLRGLLLSLSDDWRALAIRTSASLYRLRGTLNERYSSQQFSGLHLDAPSEKTITSAQIVREAREALYVYAPLAQRLGMNRLKSELEDTAFRVLYRRQYMITKSLYDKTGTSIQSVMTSLKLHIEHLLKNDDWLSSQVERVSVSARIKQPYSLWKKLVKQRFEILESEKHSSDGLIHRMNKLSLLNVKDTVAFRIVLRAQRHDPTDDNASGESFDKFLCYYVEKLLLAEWSTIDCRRKDYIANPKPNGYQSLHHTASVFRYGEHWPFEVQIRSEAMHINLEFRDASHWTYKGHQDVHAIAAGKSVGSEGIVVLPQASPIALPQQKTPDLLDAEDKKLGLRKKKTTKSLYIDALTSARDDLLDNATFIFVSSTNNAFDGKIVSVLVGSNVRDALGFICERFDLQIDSNYKLEASNLKINGNLVELDEKINNGDILTIHGLSLDHKTIKT